MEFKLTKSGSDEGKYGLEDPHSPQHLVPFNLDN